MARGGVPHYRRELAGEVRDLTLKEIKSILVEAKDKDGKLKYDKKFREAVILKLAGNVLPRLNEHTGADGKDLMINFNEAFKPTSKAKRDNSK